MFSILLMTNFLFALQIMYKIFITFETNIHALISCIHFIYKLLGTLAAIEVESLVKFKANSNIIMAGQSHAGKSTFVFELLNQVLFCLRMQSVNAANIGRRCEIYSS